MTVVRGPPLFLVGYCCSDALYIISAPRRPPDEITGESRMFTSALKRKQGYLHYCSCANNMHPKNPYFNNKPDFARLASRYPDFAPL